MVRQELAGTRWWRWRGQALPDHRAGQHVQCGEQGGGAVAPVVVGHRLARPCIIGSDGWRAVQCLHRGLLVHAQHDRLLGRVQVQPDDIDQLLLKLRVVGQLECLDPVRFQPPRSTPAAPCLRHPAPRPSSGSSNGFALRVEFLVRSRSRRSCPAGSRVSGHDPRGPARTSPNPPRRTGHATPPSPATPQRPRDPRVRHTIGRHQQRLRPHHLPMRPGLRPRQRLQHLTLSCRHL